MIRRRSRGRRFVLSIAITGFLVGAATHAIDFARIGLRPYCWAPPALELFWTTLLPLDLAAALLLAVRRRAGLLLAVAIMLLDVGANSIALFALDLSVLAAPLMIQASFLGFLLVSFGILWPEAEQAR